MEQLPSLALLDTKLEFAKKFEIEIETKNEVVSFVFMLVFDISFDATTGEIIVECSEDSLNKFGDFDEQLEHY
ncbi:MAG: hypothetical protein ABIC91_05940 [Nanoarchaeota archaeon]|nr:hypothetical protein [Nanoarchaeota archaeon]MBU1030990.1 hypothetical protein [Nanoarchaeota archaeon]MBU1849901.1 hypothetical protein [Nanoarchaeota archaeon]